MLIRRRARHLKKDYGCPVDVFLLRMHHLFVSYFVCAPSCLGVLFNSDMIPSLFAVEDREKKQTTY